MSGSLPERKNSPRPSHAMRITWWLSRTHAINSGCEIYCYNRFLQNGKKYWRRSEKWPMNDPLGTWCWIFTPPVETINACLSQLLKEEGFVRCHQFSSWSLVEKKIVTWRFIHPYNEDGLQRIDSNESCYEVKLCGFHDSFAFAKLCWKDAWIPKNTITNPWNKSLSVIACDVYVPSSQAYNNEGLWRLDSLSGKKWLRKLSFSQWKKKWMSFNLDFSDFLLWFTQEYLRVPLAEEYASDTNTQCGCRCWKRWVHPLPTPPWVLERRQLHEPTRQWVWEESHALFGYRQVEPAHHPVKVTWPRDPRSDTNNPERSLTNLLPRVVRVILEVEEEAVPVAVVVAEEEEVEVEVEVAEEAEEILHLPLHHQHRVPVLHAGDDDDDDEVVSWIKLKCNNNLKKFCKNNNKRQLGDVSLVSRPQTRSPRPIKNGRRPHRDPQFNQCTKLSTSRWWWWEDADDDVNVRKKILGAGVLKALSVLGPVGKGATLGMAKALGHGAVKLGNEKRFKGAALGAATSGAAYGVRKITQKET